MNRGSLYLFTALGAMASCIFAPAPCRAQSIQGSLGRLFLEDGAIRLRLFVKERNLPFLFGIRPPRDHHAPDHLRSILRNHRERLLKILRDRVRIEIDGVFLVPELETLDALPRHYALFELVFPLSGNSVPPEAFRLHYLFPGNPDQSDALALAVYDRTPLDTSTEVVFLHGSRKAASWSPGNLKTETVDFPDRSGLPAPLPGIFFFALAVLFFPVFINFMENRRHA
jgi:hypothetical protein